MGLSRTVSEIDVNFCRKSQNFPTYPGHPRVYWAPAEELGTGARSQKTKMMELPGRKRSLTISSAVWMRDTNVTDGQTHTGRHQRPRLRIVSRGKMALWVTFANVILYQIQRFHNLLFFSAGALTTCNAVMRLATGRTE